MNKDIEDFVATCEICKTSKYDRRPPKLKHLPIPMGSKPFEHLHIDIFKIAKEPYLTLLDNFSRYGQAYPLTATTRAEIIEKINQYMNHHGKPLKISVDSGTEFKNRDLQDFYQLHQIELHFTTTKNSSSTSPVERFHSTLIELFRCLQAEHKRRNPRQIMTGAVLAYNNSIHSVTKYTPLQVIKGHVNDRDPPRNDRSSNNLRVRSKT